MSLIGFDFERRHDLQRGLHQRMRERNSAGLSLEEAVELRINRVPGGHLGDDIFNLLMNPLDY